jgi:hypothetical protein
METKLFEVRDRGTFIPLIGIRLIPDSEEERYMLASIGYGLELETQGKYILAGKAEGGRLTYDWRGHDGYPDIATGAQIYIGALGRIVFGRCYRCRVHFR